MHTTKFGSFNLDICSSRYEFPKFDLISRKRIKKNPKPKPLTTGSRLVNGPTRQSHRTEERWLTGDSSPSAMAPAVASSPTCSTRRTALTEVGDVT
jgi:hypothetical protein